MRPLRIAHVDSLRLTRDFSWAAPSARDLAQQVPRAVNSAADAAANRALDSGDFQCFYDESLEEFLTRMFATSKYAPVGLLTALMGPAGAILAQRQLDSVYGGVIG